MYSQILVRKSKGNFHGVVTRNCTTLYPNAVFYFLKHKRSLITFVWQYQQMMGSGNLYRPRITESQFIIVSIADINITAPIFNASPRKDSGADVGTIKPSVVVYQLYINNISGLRNKERSKRIISSSIRNRAGQLNDRYTFSFIIKIELITNYFRQTYQMDLEKNYNFNNHHSSELVIKKKRPQIVGLLTC